MDLHGKTTEATARPCLAVSWVMERYVAQEIRGVGAIVCLQPWDLALGW